MAADYWKQRAERDMDAAQEAAAERLVRISRACRQASQDLAAQVEKIIGTYAKRFKLTRAEALEALRAPFDEDSRAYAYRLNCARWKKASWTNCGNRPVRQPQEMPKACWKL